jgi:hypothetical protein
MTYTEKSLSALISAQNTQRKNEHHVEFFNVKPVVRKKTARL